MRYRVLGPVTAHRADEPIELIGLQRALLALLLIDANRVVSTDRIIDELWDDTGKDRQNSLWVVVSRLRSALEPDRPKRSDGSILVTRPPGYMLSVDADAVDSLRFQSLVTEGRTLIDPDPKAASLVLNEALALWRGHAFEEFTYHAFAEAEIARLTELRVATVEDRIGADLRAGRCHDLVAELESLVRQHPERERLAAHFMVALHQSGRQAEALRAFTTYRSYLAEEVGLDPSDEITRLEQQILLDDPMLRTPELPRRPTGPVTGLSVRGYELRELIGSGATGNVYAAFQPSVGREVAIKVVRPEMADDPDFIRRFEAEARVVAGLEHPRVVPVYDYWRENGGAYLVMRRFEGGNLRTILERGGPPSADASRHIVEEVAGALAAAHERGVTHGDLRPANILIDGDGHAYLADFGLSYDLTTSARGEAEFMAPEQVETGRPSVASDVYALGALLDRLGIAPTDSTLRDVVDRACAPDPTERFDDAGAFLVAYTAATGNPTASAADPTGPNPYRGLEAFQEANAAVFFGRERLIERLLARIGAHGPAGRFVALVGPSGSGKSSVVRAGLVPALRLGAVPGSERWFIATVVPGRHPFASLAEALQPIAVDPPDDLPGQLRVGGVAPVVKRILADDAAQVLLIIDQLEELFVQSDPAEAAEFLSAVAAAVADRRSVVRVVATLRADFYDEPLRHPEFGELMRLGTDAITPLNPSEVERAITGPAAHVGVDVDPGVVAAIASDMVGQPTALPLMQFALTELYEQRSSQTITVDDYLELGGLTSALGSRADAVLADIPSAQHADVRDIFLRLVTLTDDAADTRRRARLSELTSSARSDVSAVLEPFVHHRLLSVDRDPVSRGPTVEIAHEALLSEWTTLRDWIDGARGDVRLHRRLTAAVAEWVASDRDSDYLLAGAQLSAYSTWRAHLPVRLTGDEHAFLLASRDRSEAELVVERRRTRRLRRLVAGVAVGLVAALVAGGLAYRQGRRADDEATLARQAADEAERQTQVAVGATKEADLATLISRSAAQSAQNPERSMLLALEAYRRSPGSETEQAVLNAVGSSRIPNRIATFPILGTGNCPTPVLADGQGVRSYAHVDGRLLSQDLSTGQITDHRSSDEACGVWLGDPDSNRAVAGNADATRSWVGSFDDPYAIELEQTGEMYLQPTELGTGVVAFAVEPDGGQRVALFDADTGEQIGGPIGDGSLDEVLNGVTVDASGSFAAVSHERRGAAEGAGRMRVVDAETGDELFRLDTSASAKSIRFSPTTRELIAGMTDGSIMIVDLVTGEITSTLTTTATSAVTTIGIRPDGLIVAVSEGQIELVDRRSGPTGVVVELRDVIDARVREDGTVVTATAAYNHELIEVDGNGLVEHSWPVDPFVRVAFNAGRAALLNELNQDLMIVELSTGEQTESELRNADGTRFVVDGVYPEPDGVWALAYRGVIARFDGTTMTERLDFAGRLHTWTRFGDMIAVLGRDAAGDRVASLISLDRDAAQILFSVPASTGATVHPSLDGGMHVYDADGTLHTYDQRGEQISEVESGAGFAPVITMDPTTGVVAVAPDRGGVVVFDPVAGEATQLPESSSVANLGLARDGQLLVITGFDGTVRVWDLDREEPAGLVWNGNGVAVLSSPSWYDPSTDSIWVFTSGRILAVPLDPQQWVERACDIVGRELTPDEWDRYVPGDDEIQSACA